MTRPLRTDAWTADQVEVLARSVVRAPSVHNIQPWTLEFDGPTVLLHERQDLDLPYHDPSGRDRTLSCGAALAHLELAMRVLGRKVATTLFPDPLRPSVVAAVTPTGVRVPDVEDLRLFSAIARRRSHRQRFGAAAVASHQVDAFAAVAATEDVTVRPVRDELELSGVADVLELSAQAYQHDRGYQRELALWTIRDERYHRHGVGIAASCLPPGSLPWAGLVRPATALPDREVLRRRMTDETLLVFSTRGDSRPEHLRAGHAMERVWLTAVDAGLAASVLTQPLQLPEVRAGLRNQLELGGFPQVLMRVGHGTAQAPASPRRSVYEVLER